MTTIGLHSPIAGTRDFDELPANPGLSRGEGEHSEREHEPCPRCGGRKAAKSRVCRACNNYAVQHAKRLRRQFEAWLQRRHNA